MIADPAMAGSDTSQWHPLNIGHENIIDLVGQGYEIKSVEHDVFLQDRRRVEVVYLQRGKEVARCLEITDGVSLGYPFGLDGPSTPFFHQCFELARPSHR
jgi:hypothetical protein